jgi:hypothetical protein
MRRFAPIAFLLALATLVSAAPASAVEEFVAQCPYSHRAPNDPIVFPKMKGASHMHDFFGNRTVNHRSTARSLKRGRTNCRPRSDRSGYWVPTLYVAGKEVKPIRGTFYYQSSLDDTGAIRPYPFGLRVIAGDAKATRPPADKNAIWGCLGTGVGGLQEFPDCPADNTLEVLVDFPECWNGRDLDSKDHKRHMAYPTTGKCPSGHPVPVPKLQFKLTYATAGGGDAKLASGAAFTMHADFFNAWEPRALNQRIVSCLHPGETKCGVDGRPID